MPVIKTGTGFSALKDSFDAGKEAAEMALRHAGGEPQALLVFASSCFEHEALLAGVRSEAGDIPMAGGSTAGEISSRGFTEDSVVILALASDTLRFSTAYAQGVQDQPFECASAFASSMFASNRVTNPLALIVFPDGQTHDGTAVIEGVQSQLTRPLDLVGGFLGHGDRLGPTFQYHDGNVMKNILTGLLIHGPDHLKIVKTATGWGSGFNSIGNSMVCTASSGNVLEKIDHEPALDFYMEVLGEKRSARLPEVCLEYPFGLVDPGDAGFSPAWIQIRSGISVDYEKRTITMAGPIPRGSRMTLATCSRGDLINAARSSAEQARERLDGCRIELVLVFSCVGRKNVLGRRVNEEIQAVREVFGEDVPLVGMYTHGEIGSAGIPGPGEQHVLFHNEAIVVWGLGSKQ